MIDVIGKILLGVGAGFGVIGSIGVLRMPDVYNRIHSQTLCVVGGAILILFGVLLLEGFSSYGLKALIIAIFLFVTNPVGSHAIARAAHKSGVKLWPESIGDKLKEERR
ncbi:hypothetical protein AKJ42_02480 [candidate division MSBL1 archaeon SCGC-AAA261C02]|uniref:Cation:proton antiporter n=1 Tax=candidate division MSBL1 archaeon SCGC-AAA261C02 TaxID=1698272 RepID=A0A133V018_9EURY|nr:hypothetical protein AKJ42_02480 [candidate division MSBL1 archaeon SCGC-AAA261C02]